MQESIDLSSNLYDQELSFYSLKILQNLYGKASRESRYELLCIIRDMSNDLCVYMIFNKTFEK